MSSWSKPINHANLSDLTDFPLLTFDGDSDNESYLCEGLCVPHDRLEDIDFFPNFRDDRIRVVTRSEPKPDNSRRKQEIRIKVDKKGLSEEASEVENQTLMPKLHREAASFPALPKQGSGTKKPKGKVGNGIGRKPFQDKNQYFSRQEERRRCGHCETGETPQWRMGPMGKGTLCNACGIKYLKGELLPDYRPAASPSFDTSKHSNYIRRIVRMKKSVFEDDRL